MIDLHTHILPGMDDGAAHSADSIEMLKLEAAQGVDAVVLTPHFYRDRETAESFLKRREVAYAHLCARIAELPPEERQALPVMTLGAEVTWMENCSRWDGLEALCYAGTRYLLLEPPFIPWQESWFHDLSDLMNATGLTPVIAHLDRYVRYQKKEAIRELLSYGLPVQVSADSLLHLGSRGWVLEQMKNGSVQLLISDCHDTDKRAPNVGKALEVIERKLGKDAAKRLSRESERIIA